MGPFWTTRRLIMQTPVAHGVSQDLIERKLGKVTQKPSETPQIDVHWDPPVTIKLFQRVLGKA